MSSYAVNISLRAIADIDDIREFIAQGSTERADRVVDQLFAEIRSLGELPMRAISVGRSKRTGRLVRRVLVYPYLIYYLTNEDTRAVDVLFIVHGARRQPRRFN